MLMLLFAAALTAAAPLAPPQANCPRTTSHYAWRRDQKVEPRKLTELPSAEGYMAVYRLIGGCEAPLTMIEYRRGAKR
jgi:hypothetical protein